MLSVITVKAGQLIFVGMFLSCGFWLGKKLTSRIDQFIFTHSKEFSHLKNLEEPTMETLVR